ncbi:putative electron transport complex, RnfABCDGE type, A subunit [Alteracholeplasma palmae J233]|uniref:Putative electron transport complex, RnfABCDGE type, A subunit n=1 Tax=Alteracholeplasma palmae (strain ATCC 49389 / J233) TaxID=1318466 RepID=U4KLT6_ALTPJ|nr:Rnf-Nqr domain containing protein [Alteracholeplasma palmae]CCV64949.1 putative electron transport complex, RnfABCDGE type, A subunit [Alteracholeplasma palmae J233]
MIFTFIATILSALFYQNVVLTKTALTEDSLKDETRIVPVLKYSGCVSLFTLVIFLVSYPIYQYGLKPFDLGYFNYLLVVLLMVGLHALITYLLNKKNKDQYKELISNMILNSAVIFITLMSYQENSFLSALAVVLGSLLGYMGVMVLLTTIQVRLKTAPDSLVIKGLPMLLIILGVMAVAFRGLAGIF